MPPGRPRKNKKSNADSKGLPIPSNAPKMPPVKPATVEVKESGLHISASVGACFKTGRVGITSLTIQTNYDGDVKEAVDKLSKLCLSEWNRLESNGLTQIINDTHYESQIASAVSQNSSTAAGKVNTEYDNSSDEPVSTVSDFSSDITEQFGEDFDLSEFDSEVQDVSTVKDAEQVLDSIEKNEQQKLEEESGFGGKTEDQNPAPDVDPIVDGFDPDDVLKVEELAETPEITEEIIEEPGVDEYGDVVHEDINEDPAEVLGFAGAEEPDFKVPEEDNEENEINVLTVFDLTPEQQIEELKKRKVTEINGVPLDKVPSPDIILALDSILSKETE